MRIENAIVLVTGANRGIGLTFARELLSRGARKVYAGARDPATVPSGCSNPAARRDQARRCGGRRATGVRCDPRDQQRRHRSTGGFLAPDSEGVARRLFETNFFAMLRMSQAFAPVLKSNGGGALLNVLSIASWMNGGELAAYAASKSGRWTAWSGDSTRCWPTN